MTDPKATPSLKPGDWIRGPFWPTIVQVVSVQPRTNNHIQLTIHVSGQEQSHTYIILSADLEKVTLEIPADRRHITFDGDPYRFRLGLEACRLRLAHSIDPYAALNASRIDPLPHQFEAVYQHLLARPIVRALLAHDAGAGKTIMAGMLIKELKRRQGVRRILIVAPAGLKWQWRRELLTKFGEKFEIVDRDYMRQTRLDRLDVWRKTNFAITSVAYARQPIVRQVLETVEWDMVIMDEAHSMAAYKRANNSIRRTQAYELGEVLSRHTIHFLLMTATPHKGDPDNYQLLLKLVDPHWGEASTHAPGANPLILRRTKEEMCQQDGTPLYPERVVETIPYNLSYPEGELLEKLQKYIKQRYGKVRNQQSALFALITLERRLASSPYAMQESLVRMRSKVEARGQQSRPQSGESDQSEDWAEWEDLSEDERWQKEAEAEIAVANLVDPRQIKEELRQIDALIARSQAIITQGQQEKITQLQKACEHWVKHNGEQAIIFTEFKDTLDYLVQCLQQWGYTTTEIHGGMDVLERRKAEETFWEGNARILIATEAAGEGINLQCCRTMINFDLPWNPCRLEQRMGRIHRYGQKADRVFIFNLLAQNSIEDEVKEAIIKKQMQMKKDLGDKVFDVVGQVLWGQELRAVFERIAQGDVTARQEALDLIEQAGNQAKEALLAEQQATAMRKPIDITAFQREQATFAARRLSPELAEKFFREAILFAGGTSKEEPATIDNQLYPIFTITLPPDFETSLRQRRYRFSFWSPTCTDDDIAVDAVHFIAPGHWLLEGLMDRVTQLCQIDLNKGAVFADLEPENDVPYLVWFVQSHIRDGLDRRVGDVLAAVCHRADEEQIIPMPTEILHGFDQIVGQEINDTLRLIKPMLSGQSEVVNQCVDLLFLPELAERRAEKMTTLAQDREFLTEGLSRLCEHLNDAALEAFANGDIDAGEQMNTRTYDIEQRLIDLQQEMFLSEQLLLLSPDVLGVAMVLPMPVEVNTHQTNGSAQMLPMRRDPLVEAAAMNKVLAYEREQGRHPHDVHVGHSWDIESDNDNGIISRYIEVKGRGPQEANEVILTEPEWQAARRLGDKYWLYVVRLEDNMMWLIQNPYVRLKPKELKRWLVSLSEVAAHTETIIISTPSA